MLEVEQERSGFAARVFPDRTVTIGQANHVRALKLSPRNQLLGTACAIALGAWTLGASGLAAVQSWRSAQERAALSQTEAAYEARLARLRDELARAQASGAASARRADAAVEALGARQDALADAAMRERELSQALSSSRARAESVTDLKRETERLARIETDRDELGTALSMLAARLSDAASERDAARAQSAEFEMAISRMEQSAQRREMLLSELGHAAEMTIAPLEQMLRGVGVDVDSLVRDLKSEGAGGPFVPIDRDDQAFTPRSGAQIASVISDLERVNLLRAAADRMPFARPVAHMNVSSRFGYRRDPLNRRAAMHQGVDFRGARGTAISSTANGVVTFSGRQRGYGAVVRIRHDFGFETVYAHLNRRRVKVGDRVEAGDRIGDMGNTGRSTGVHLHYEIRVNGRPVDPLKFIEASRNVL